MVAAAAASSGYVLTRPPSRAAGAELRPSGIPASVPTGLDNLMALDSLPRRPAPEFTLTDQTGRTVSLSMFRGKAVVLEFMDPHCTDICPIISQEFVNAYHDLGRSAANVVFAAVNVNPYYRSPRTMAAFSTEQRLTAIPSWHYLTGPLPALRKTWRDFHIYVSAPSPNADVIHTSASYLIDPPGRERYVATAEDVKHTKPCVAYGVKDETGYLHPPR